MIFTHKTKGGSYQVVAEPAAAGKIKHLSKLVFYRCTKTGDPYVREVDDFAESMIELEGIDSGDSFTLNRIMIACPACGNKRCPKAASEKYLCTNSNAPNQTPQEG